VYDADIPNGADFLSLIDGRGVRKSAKTQDVTAASTHALDAMALLEGLIMQKRLANERAKQTIVWRHGTPLRGYCATVQM
jgi:hypothetical protein